MTPRALLAAVLLLSFGSAALASEWVFTYGVEYASSTTAGQNQTVTSTQLLPTISARLRGLVAPATGAYADLAASGWGSYGDGSSLALQSSSLNLYGTAPTYNLLLSIGRLSLQSGSATGQVSSVSDAVTASAGLRPWRDLFASVQYATSTLNSVNGSSRLASTSTSLLLGGYLTLRPFALTYTKYRVRSDVTSGAPATSTADTTAFGLLLDQPLTPSVGLQISATTADTRVEDSTGVQDRTEQSLLVRLSTFPMQGLAVDGWLLYSPQVSPSSATGAGIRAQPLRNLLLDASYQSGRTWRSWQASVRAVPVGRMLLAAVASGSEQEVNGQRLYDQRVSTFLLVRLSPVVDLELDYFTSRGAANVPWEFDEWAVGYLQRVNPRLSYRLGYSDSREVDGTTELRVHSLWGDASWLLSPAVSLSVAARNDLSNGGTTSVTSAWARWALDTRTDLLLSYVHQRQPGEALPAASVTLSRRLSESASVQVSYYASAGSGWDRQSVVMFLQGTWVPGGL